MVKRVATIPAPLLVPNNARHRNAAVEHQCSGHRGGAGWLAEGPVPRQPVPQLYLQERQGDPPHRAPSWDLAAARAPGLAASGGRPGPIDRPTHPPNSPSRQGPTGRELTTGWCAGLRSSATRRSASMSGRRTSCPSSPSSRRFRPSAPTPASCRRSASRSTTGGARCAEQPVLCASDTVIANGFFAGHARDLARQRRAGLIDPVRDQLRPADHYRGLVQPQVRVVAYSCNPYGRSLLQLQANIE